MGKSISLEQYNSINSYIKNLNCNLSEYSFSNLYLFSEIHQYEYIDTLSAISGYTYDNQYFIMTLLKITDDYIKKYKSI